MLVRSFNGGGGFDRLQSAADKPVSHNRLFRSIAVAILYALVCSVVPCSCYDTYHITQTTHQILIV